MSKKEQKWLKREAENEKAESEARKTIPELTHAIEELVSGRKKPEELEGIIAEAKTLAQQWKDPHSAKHPKDRLPLFDGTTANRTFLLVSLVVALRPSYQCFETIRRYCPNELENLISASGHREFRAFVSALSDTLLEPPPKRKYERKRRKWHRSFFNSIEYQFGGGLENESKNQTLLFRPDDPVYKSVLSSMQDCLDDIFAGQNVNMLRLEDLFFGIERHRLAKLVSLEDKKRRKYGHRVVVKVMDALLTKNPRKKRKRSTPGRPRQMPWLNDADLRTRVLSGIEARIKGIANVLLSIALEETDLSKLTGKEITLVSTVFEHFPAYAEWQKEIADPFLAVVHGHLRNSGKK